ncbi:MAG: hypothetical protein JRI22_19460 [Deltaproteobacteria bacterium]|nr:hypothetical protein [Deltaproteobacteria bacterium]
MVNYTKTIVCLANSRRSSGRCIAGKEMLRSGYGGWIRPVSARQSAELSEEERRYEDGRDPRVLDIVVVPMIAHAPLLHHTENHIIDANYYWTKTKVLPWTKLGHLLDNPETLWPSGDSTYYGSNDRVKLEVASKLKVSLLLIKPEDLVLSVQAEGAEFGNPRRRVRAQFEYRGTSYNLVVTDPVAERAFLSKANGDYRIADTYLCVSLSEAHSDGYCYKLVAAVISKQSLRGQR